MASLKLICLVISLVLFFIAAFWDWWNPTQKVNVAAAGLFFYALKDLLP